MSESVLSPAVGSAADYRRARVLSRSQRAAAWGAVATVHVAVVGGLALASLQTKAPPPAPTIMVSMISETTSPAPTPTPPPPQPKPLEPTPQPKMVAAPRPTASPMMAPPPEEPVRPSPPQPSAAPSAPAAAAPSTAATGPSITPPNFTAAYLNNPGPQYPYASRRKREQGIVKLHVLVNANGRPEKVEIARSSGFPLLDQAALDVVKNRWRFAPAKQDGKAVSASVVVPLEFELKDR